MARFIAKLDDDSHINISADAIEITANDIIAWKGDLIVAYINKDFCRCAHLSNDSRCKEKQE